MTGETEEGVGMVAYEQLLLELSDVLEGGDVILDYEDFPSAQATLSCIDAIISTKLRNIRETRELQSKLTWIRTGQAPTNTGDEK